MLQNITRNAEALAKAFTTPLKTVTAWPESGPKNVEEGYQTQNELHKLLQKKQVGWKVMNTDWSNVCSKQ